jgi:hypothetical protein
MRRLGVSRSLLGAAAATLTACSVWAALDDPYKSDAPGPGDGGDSAGDAGGPRDAAVGRRVLDAGFVPYAIAVHGDTTYAVDPLGGVHVAHDASTNFTDFWTGDGGDTFALQTNAIAATASGVFWTVSGGIHHCGVDGGGCGFLPVSGAPRAVAASDPVVAWIDNGGVRTCAMGLAGCVPTSVAGSRGAVSVAVGPPGIVAWTDGGSTVQLEDGTRSSSIPVRFDVALVATDDLSGSLYLVGQGGVGFMPFDGGPGAAFPLTSMTKPIEFFARRGVAYWSLRGNSGIVLYCRCDSGAGCSPKLLVNGLTPAPTTNDGIVATSRDVLAIVSSNVGSELFVWRLPP